MGLAGVIRDQLMVGITMLSVSFRIRCLAKMDCQLPENKLEAVCTSQVTGSGSAVPHLAARNVAQLLEEIPSIRLCRTHVLAGNASKGLVGNDLSSRDRLSRAEEIKTRDLAEHLKKKFGSRPHGVTPTTPCADSANAQNMQDKTGSSSSVVPPKGDEPSSDECAAPVAKRSQVNFVGRDPGEIPIKSRQPLVERGHAQKNLVKWTPTTPEVRVLLVAHVWFLLSRWFCSCTGPQRKEERYATHDDAYVDPELIIREEHSVNNKMDVENFVRKLVAVAKEEELRKFAKLKVHEVVSKEEFRRDLKAINIGTCGLPVAIWFKVFCSRVPFFFLRHFQAEPLREAPWQPSSVLLSGGSSDVCVRGGGMSKSASFLRHCTPPLGSQDNHRA